MSKLTLNDLPEVFVPFETVKANTGKVIYYNKELGFTLTASELMSKYNYITIDTALESDNFLDRKVFFAERYGGDGISTNGGGGRCGFDGVFQLKGLGPNQLVGDRPRDTYGNSHANGLLSLDVAIYEAIWAEVINIALPYGAVRTVAVIDLEHDFEEPDQKHARGLLIRLPVVRPAHFIRAIYYKEAKKDVISEDAKRVMLAIRKLVGFLPRQSFANKASSLDEQLSLGMVELASRYAKQFAAARAKRIFHQSISASNLTIDGAWIDLAGATVFSNKVWWEGFNIKKFLREYEPAIESIRDMCYYLFKYKVVTVEVSNAMLEMAINKFEKDYEESLSTYNAAQAGFPYDLLSVLKGDDRFLNFSKLMNKVLERDQYSLTSIFTTGGWEGGEHWVSDIYRGLLSRKIPKVRSFELSSELGVAYDELFELVWEKAEDLGVSYTAFCKFLAINVVRLNRCGLLLVDLQDKVAQVRQAKEVERRCGKYDGLFEDAIDMAYLNYSYAKGFRTLFWKNGVVEIFYDASVDLFFASIKGGKEVSGTLLALIKFGFLMRGAISFYDDVIEMIYE